MQLLYIYSIFLFWVELFSYFCSPKEWKRNCPIFKVMKRTNKLGTEKKKKKCCAGMAHIILLGQCYPTFLSSGSTK